MPILSLCTGYGGLDMAVEALTGDKVAYVADNDEAASLVLAHHWPGVPNLGDIMTYDFRELRGEVDKVAAGFSCQDVSNAGGRGGINGSRSRVWKDVCRAVRDIRPGFVFLENVAALRSRGLNTVAEDLAQVGYDLWWTTFRASVPTVGAAHHRDRWFGVAVPHAYSGGRNGGTGDEPEEDGRDEPSDRGHSPAEWWGEYLPAIRRWEDRVGVPAPAPTELGPRGGRRLTALFAEWLMGVPGHITSVPGLTRAQQLHKAGNGAMPQQAYVAYEYLLKQIKENS